jgi:hypothetical protein
MATEYSALLIRLWAEIADTEIDVVQFTSVFEMNRIPKATAVLPVGRNVSTLEISAAHDAAKLHSLQFPAKVYGEFTWKAGQKPPDCVIPEGRYVLFEGSVTGVGYVRGTRKLQLAVEMTHWLNALNYASALSASSHPGNPAQFIFNPSMPDRAGDDAEVAGAGFSQHFLAKTMAQSHIDEAAVQEDLWGKGILPWFEALAGADRLSVRDLEPPPGGDPAATAALARFDGETLPLDIQPADAPLVAKAIAEDIAVTGTDPSKNTNWYLPMANTTLWAKLVGDLAPNYMFSVIPFPTKAKVVPFIPGLRTHWQPDEDEDFTIKGRDMDLVDVNSQLPRPLRAMMLFAAQNNAAGASFIPGTPPELQVGGGHVADRADGMVIFKRAPQWLSHFVVESEYADKAAGVGGVKGGAIWPRVGEAPDKPDPKAVLLRARPMIDQMAHSLFANEALKGRSGQISGALRFDVAPGSTIRFEGTSGRFIDEEQGQDLFGAVVRVTYYIDAETPRAGTAYHIAHVRNEPENEDDDTSLTKHPLYAEDAIWPGAVHIEADEAEVDFADEAEAAAAANVAAGAVAPAV